jgi:Adenylate and Guanylate cyclase catalytic domain
MATATITVVFTDLVGSTELLSRVGEARADELRREHFGLLRAAVAGHGGPEVKNLGDGLMVIFDGVASALDAAVVMQQAITARPAESEPLSIKIGVAVGDAELEDDDYFGSPVVEAARLCAKAQGGEILTTEFVRMLARSRSKVELESVGRRAPSAFDCLPRDRELFDFVRWLAWRVPRREGRTSGRLERNCCDSRGCLPRRRTEGSHRPARQRLTPGAAATRSHVTRAAAICRA